MELLNYEEKWDNVNFDNKEFDIQIKLATETLYTVEQFHNEKISIIDKLKIKHLTSLWIPIGKFYSTETHRNVNGTVSIKLIDKTKYMEDEYKSSLTFPASLLEIRNDIYEQLQIHSDTAEFFNCNELVETKPEGYSYKQILGYIAECACGFEIINRLGNGELKQYNTDFNKNIPKGAFKEFIPAEGLITIKKIKYFNGIIGEESGHILELSDDNPLVSDSIAHNILTKMNGFTYIPYMQRLSEADIAMDCGDKIKNTDKKGKIFESYIMQNSWEFTGSLTQNWAAKGENEFNNSFSSSKGPMGQAIDRIQNVEIPGVYEKAVDKATELITEFNGGYVVKKDGELFIVDNEDLDKAKKVWRWNINGFGYSSKGIKGPYRNSYYNGWTDCSRFYYHW